MPKVSDEYRAARRGEITSAAMRAFRRKGFHATSMADIIAEAGLSAGAIYGHFASKNDIVLEVSTRIISARLGELEELAASEPMPSPAELIRVLMGGMLNDIQPAMLVQVWGESITDSSVHDLANGVMGRLRGVFTDYIALWHERAHDSSPEVARGLAVEQVVLFLATVQGFIIQSALFDDFDGEAFLTSIEKYLPR